MKTQRHMVVGLLLGIVLLAGTQTAGAQVRDLFNNGNTFAVRSGGAINPRFLLNVPTTITQVVTYHWNDRQGARPGIISLRGVNNVGVPNGLFFGPFSASGTAGSGIPNVNWVANMNVNVPGGFYEVVDSDPRTWSNNFQSASQGFAVVRGFARTTPPPPPPPTGGGSGSDLFNNTNTDAVRNNPVSAPQFTLRVPTTITQVVTYHWNDRRGATPGFITITTRNRQVVGQFRARGTAGQGGVPNVNWIATPNVILQPGRYTVLDSDPITWSNNARSAFVGFAIVRGSAVTGPGPMPPPTPADLGSDSPDTPTLLIPAASMPVVAPGLLGQMIADGIGGADTDDWYSITVAGPNGSQRARSVIFVLSGFTGPITLALHTDERIPPFARRDIVVSAGPLGPGTRSFAPSLFPGRYLVRVTRTGAPTTYGLAISTPAL